MAGTGRLRRERMKQVILIVSLLLCVDLLYAQEETYRNSIGMEFVLIPSGDFLMGIDRRFEKGRHDEMPKHGVHLNHSFYMAKYEVTQAQWVKVMGSNPSRFKADNHPVERVSWEDVQRFIKQLNQKEGDNKYRLPTEAEWEYSARAGTITSYFFGNDAAQLGQYAWYNDNSEKTTHPVGQKNPSPWGLYDIYGNVWEWVQDWYDRKYYIVASPHDPKGPPSSHYRVNRGGSWYSNAFFLRSSNRSAYSPDFHKEFLGFRLLRMR